MRSVLFAAKRIGKLRVLPCFLALIMLLSTVPMTVFSVDAGEEPVANESTVPTPNELIYDYDTLKITLDGEETYALSLYEHEKIEICATGVSEQATYQWQIQHNEKDDLWVDIYDATDPTLSLTAALIGGVLRDDGTAKVRCRAYTSDYAYLTTPFTVTLLEEEPVTYLSTPMQSADMPSFMADGDGDAILPEFVTVTIEYYKREYVYDYEASDYVLSDPIRAFDPYIATLVYNGSLNRTVNNPTIVGYKPYFEDETVSQSSVSISLSNIKEDVVYRVTYLPSADTKYQVRYMFQNIYDDLYVEDTSIAEPFVGSGYTGRQPEQGIKDVEFEGFTSLYYEPDTIAADGSTVFEVYYERNYYLMEFDCDKGYGVNTIYVRYGTYISVPYPIRAGYVFDKDGDGNGWDLVDTEQVGYTGPLADRVADPLPTNMPPYNSAYKAIWETAATTYTVVYWRENADDAEYSFWGSTLIGADANGIPNGTVISATKVSGKDDVPTSVSNAIVDGETINEKPFFTFDAEKTDKDILVEGDGSTVVNVYYTRNVYTINFKVVGNFSVPDDVKTHVHGDGTCTFPLICGQQNHEHDGNCVKTLSCFIPVHDAHTDECLTCKLTEHAHGASCMNCGLPGHVHSAECCTIEPHAHTTACYTFSTNNVYWGNAVTDTDTIEELEALEPNANGIVSYNYNRYYYKLGDTWYRLNSSGGGVNWYNVTISQSCTKTEHVHDNGACTCAEHTHVASCWVCGLDAHTHSIACCTLQPHEHVRDCYSVTNGSLATNPVTQQYTINQLNNRDPEDNGLVTYNYNRYYKIGDSWYQVNRNNNYISWDNVTVTLSCGKTAHNHNTGGCVYCSKKEHLHNASCYKCGLNEHDHGEHCYKDTVHTHTETCYTYSCGKGAHTHTDACYGDCIKTQNYTTGSGNDQIYTITAKYEQYIGDIWPTSSYFTGVNFTGWTIDNVDSTAVSKRLNMTEDLCDTSDKTKTATRNVSNSTYTFRLYYMFESFDQDSPTNGNDRKQYGSDDIYYDSDSKYYQELKYSSNQTFGQKQIEGMNPVGVQSSSSGGIIYNFLYYKRNRNGVFFHNVNAIIDEASHTDVMFGYQLSDLTQGGKSISEYEPPYPDTYEPGAYVFKGWYTTPECFEGTKVDWDDLTMPNTDLTLYAKWESIKRNVYFHFVYTDLETGNYWQPNPETPISYPVVVDHGSMLGTAYNFVPTRTDYQFVGWFYFDENGKKKFAPDSMAVTRDLYLFAEWKSSIPTTYNVTFEAWRINSDDTLSLVDGEIASPLSDYSTAGKTTTFEAKGANRLYDKSSSGGNNYQLNWFPETHSHSILMESESDKNTFAFRYFRKDFIQYKVVYKDRITGEVLGETKPIKTPNAIVTEKYRPFEGYYPEEFYIERSIAFDPTDYELYPDYVLPENIIYFYYIPDEEHAPFRVEHLKQNVDGVTYELAQSEQGIADLDNTITASPKTYPGFEFEYAEIITYKEVGSGESATWEPQKTKVTDPALIKGTVGLGGLEIKIYYKRLKFDYTVKYLEYGTEKLLYSDTFEDHILGSVVSHTAPVTYVLGEATYIYVDGLDSDDAQRTKYQEIFVEEDRNVMVFYYNIRRTQVNYHIVCTVPSLTGLNAISLANERIATTEDLLGSIAYAGSGFKFMGWYYDEACDEPVPASWVTDTELIPKEIVIGDDGMEHFYALFEPIYGGIEITKSGVETQDAVDHHFLFRVKGKDTNNQHIDLIVSVLGNGTVSIENVPIGDYNVTELTDWSWDYECEDDTNEVVVTEDQVSKTEFSNQTKNSNWLSGEAENENVFD